MPPVDDDMPSGERIGRQMLADTDDPLNFLADVHLRQREICALIDKLALACRPDPAELDEVREFLEQEFALHMADEEQDLFPMMRRKCKAEDEIDKLIALLQDNHKAATGEVARTLTIITRLKDRPDTISGRDRKAMQGFAAGERQHLIIENAILLPLARARLGKRDLALLRNNMQKRRSKDIAAKASPVQPDNLTNLLTRNVDWSSRCSAEEPGHFGRLAAGQAPEFFWIGCSDGPVPAHVVAGLDPGEVVVHRNIANIVHSSDMNLLSSLEFAVESLNIREIIVCGHFGCDGIKAATEALPHGLADHWLEPIRRLARQYATDLARITDPEDRRNRLAEYNVIEGVRRVAETPILQRAWERDEKILVHGLIYDLKDGLLHDLYCTVSPGHL